MGNKSVTPWDMHQVTHLFVVFHPRLWGDQAHVLHRCIIPHSFHSITYTQPHISQKTHLAHQAMHALIVTGVESLLSK